MSATATVAKAAAGAARATETVALRAIRPHRRIGQQVASGLSSATGGGRLWAGVSAGLVLHPRWRRAARDGLAGWATAEGVAFAVKSVAGRRRPTMVQALGRAPSSSSMPSSHTAGAVGYATAAALQSPVAGAVAAPLAFGVAWARAATGRHFPTDVAVGAGIGLGAGVAVHLLARRVDAHGGEEAGPGSSRPRRSVRDVGPISSPSPAPDPSPR